MFPLRSHPARRRSRAQQRQTIRANAAPRLAGNFFTIDLQQGRAAFESVPWVRRAVVRRVWPDRLAVHLEEHRAGALWVPDDGNDKLVNSFGEVFEANVGDVEDEACRACTAPKAAPRRCWRCTTGCSRCCARLTCTSSG